jgi:hypothetical protein
VEISSESHNPAGFTRGKIPDIHLNNAVWAPQLLLTSWKGASSVVLPGIRNADRPTHSLLTVLTELPGFKHLNVFSVILIK